MPKVSKLHSYSFGDMPVKAGLKLSTDEQVPVCSLGSNALNFFVKALIAAQDAKEYPNLNPTTLQIFSLQCISSWSGDMLASSSNPDPKAQAQTKLTSISSALTIGQAQSSYCQALN